jgi:hypothetical protein
LLIQIKKLRVLRFVTRVPRFDLDQAAHVDLNQRTSVQFMLIFFS